MTVEIVKDSRGKTRKVPRTFTVHLDAFNEAKLLVKLREKKERDYGKDVSYEELINLIVVRALRDWENWP